MYLCPTSEDNERQIEEISAQIQRHEETVDSLQRQNDDLSREHAKSVAQVENLQKAIAKIGADIFRHQDLEHKIKREKDILDGLRFHDKQSQVNNWKWDSFLKSVCRTVSSPDSFWNDKSEPLNGGR